MRFEEELGITDGLDFYDRRELCDYFNESDEKAFEYLLVYARGEWKVLLSSLMTRYEEVSDYKLLKEDKEYQKKLWKLLNHFGCFRNHYGEAFTKL